jgi:hypothetical protein
MDYVLEEILIEILETTVKATNIRDFLLKDLQKDTDSKEKLNDENLQEPAELLDEVEEALSTGWQIMQSS